MTLDKRGADTLVIAIVKNAVSDWRDAMRKLKRNSDSIQTNWLVLDCERFFLSGYFTVLTELNGKEFLKKLYDMHAYEFPYSMR